MSSWRETLENAFKDLGDISDLIVFDAGSEGAAARFLAERIGGGRIIGVNIWLGAYKAVREKVGDLMDKVVLIKDDMRHMDYLKDDFFDLISYATMAAIESSTPGGTFPILRQYHRILKKNGRLLIAEPLPPQEVKSVDDAQKLELELIRIHDRLIPINIYYNQSRLTELLNAIGFVEIYWKMVSEGEWLSNREVAMETNGMKNTARELVQDENEREEILRQIREISWQAKRTGLRTPPYRALYARKP